VNKDDKKTYEAGMSILMIMPDEESSEEEQEKFFNAEREPGQVPAPRGCCLGAASILLVTIALALAVIL